MATKTAGASLYDKPMHMAPKYQPKVTVRVSCGRTKQVAEFGVELPLSGESETAVEAVIEKLSDILRRMGILAPTTLSEPDHAQGNLRPEKDEKESA